MENLNLDELTIESVIKMLEETKAIKSALLGYMERNYELYKSFLLNDKFSHEIDNISETIDTLTLNLESYLWNRENSKTKKKGYKIRYDIE
jgi:translation elongation factor EF-4